MEEHHLQERHQLVKQQLKDQYFLQRHDLLRKHEKVRRGGMQDGLMAVTKKGCCSHSESLRPSPGAPFEEQESRKLCEGRRWGQAAPSLTLTPQCLALLASPWLLETAPLTPKEKEIRKKMLLRG